MYIGREALASAILRASLGDSVHVVQEAAVMQRLRSLKYQGRCKEVAKTSFGQAFILIRIRNKLQPIVHVLQMAESSGAAKAACASKIADVVHRLGDYLYIFAGEQEAQDAK